MQAGWKSEQGEPEDRDHSGPLASRAARHIDTAALRVALRRDGLAPIGPTALTLSYD